jgi:hypothetical protein
MTLFNYRAGKVNAHGLQDIAERNYTFWLFFFLHCYFVNCLNVLGHTASYKLAEHYMTQFGKKKTVFVAVKKLPVLKNNKSKRSVN